MAKKTETTKTKSSSTKAKKKTAKPAKPAKKKDASPKPKTSKKSAPARKPALKKTVAAKVTVRPENSNPVTNDDIARRAYELFVARGCGHGRDLDDWFQAEAELRG